MKISDTFDYEAELARPMCEGCNKLSGDGMVVPGYGYMCTMYKFVPPKMYIEANECPHNRRRRKAGAFVRVGQQKQGG